MSEEVKQAIMELETAINFKTATVMPMEYSIDIENAKVLLKYVEQLQMENEELKKYCCKRNDCVGRLKQNNKLTDSEILIEFEKWLWGKLNIKPANKIYASECLEKLQELKGEC